MSGRLKEIKKTKKTTKMVRAAEFEPRSPAYATTEPCRHSAGVVHCTYLTQFRTRYNYVSACRRDMNKQYMPGRIHLAVCRKKYC